MKKILVVSSFLLIIIAMSTIGYQVVSANEEITTTHDLITAQSEQEKYLTPYGYTLDNPNIMLDPYGISPLTAMILFETDQAEEVTVTIEGKDDDSTFTITFPSTTKHYLPIYGLYPDHSNIIHLTVGKITKTYTIDTTPIQVELDLSSTITPTNSKEVTFITTATYPYAVDHNQDIRWYLTKQYSGKIERLTNSHFLLSTDTKNQDNLPIGVLEIDLLGKIYKQITLDSSYYNTYAETPTSLFLLSEDLLEIDKQTGSILSQKKLSTQYQNLTYDQATNNLYLSSATESILINLNNTETTTQPSSNLTEENHFNSSLYPTNPTFQKVTPLIFNSTSKTTESKTDIFLINYKKIDKTYQSYNINFHKKSDLLEITSQFKDTDQVYIILDKFLDKRVYDLNNNITLINKDTLEGKYSIYIKINNTIYKTNTFVNF